MENDGDDREIRRHSFLKYAARAALMTSFSVNLTIPSGPPQSSGGAARPPPMHTGYLLFGLYWPGSFKSNLVLPEIPEVIFVKEPFVVAKMKVREKGLPGIG